MSLGEFKIREILEKMGNYLEFMINLTRRGR